MSQSRSVQALQFLVIVMAFLMLIKADAAALTAAPTYAPTLPPAPLTREEEGLPASSELSVSVSATNTTVSWDSRDPARPRFALPLLYLHHEREAAPTHERTLELNISGLAGGTEILIEAVSQHVNITTGAQHTTRLPFVAPERGCTDDAPCTLRWVFEDLYSDLYTLHVQDRRGGLVWETPHTSRPDFVALDSWGIRPGAVGGQEYAVHVTYATLFPYARDQHDLDRRLAPDEVIDFIEGEFVPTITETWRAQVEEWGFGDPLHPDWDRDNVVEIIITAPPFALFDGTGTYTVYHDAQGRPYPERRIWWSSTLDAFPYYYASLADHYRLLFAHEFFHLMQWNVMLTAGRASTWRPEHYWQNAFIESQGRFISSAQYPELELRRTHLLGAKSPFVGLGADRYLKGRLNGSYRTLEASPESKYDLALYWRFLYEQFGDLDVIRIALEEMVRHYDPDILNGMQVVMDATFERLDGPFRSFEESLIAFSRANYALRLDKGRCGAEDAADCDGVYFDPDHMYAKPALAAELDYAGAEVAYSGAIPGSYGMDFVEVRLHPRTDGGPLTIRLQSGGSIARYALQVWKIGPGSGLGQPYALTPRPEVIPLARSDGAGYVFRIPNVDRTAYGRLALIITRLDAEESGDPAGSYRITVASTIGHSDD